MDAERTLLIVDDSQEDRIILSSIFKNRFNILQAGDGREAMKLLVNHHSEISVILLDLFMPCMNGYEFLERIADDKQYATIPVVVITSEVDFESEVRVMELGAVDYILKPFTPSIVIGRVCNAAAEYELGIRHVNLKSGVIEDESHEELRYLAEHDSQTGLYNFRTFCVKAAELIKSANSVYAIYRLNINNFRVVNDFFGFDTGNRVLSRIGAVCNGIMEGCGVAARIASDDFVFCMPYISESHTEGVVNQVFERINSFGLDFKLMPNFGIYIADNTDVPINLMCDRAYLALRDIKGSCVKLCSFYDEKHRAAVVMEQEIVNSMYTALEDECFEVYFQPQYDYISGDIIGAEALVRWNDPKLRNVSPGVFIPVFEKNGFITKLDEYVWDKACSWLGNWLSDPANKPISISVNLSRVDIFDPTLYDKLVGLVKKYNVPVECFRLEITESAYVENPLQLVDVVKKLQSYGFLIEMDDFGSGYSSLNTLKDVPVDILKLDTKFLSGSNADKGLVILNSVVRMALWLSLPVIAEGVETAEQAEFLKSVGCNHMQGYLFSRPVPISKFEVILRANEIEPFRKSSDNLLQTLKNVKLWDNSAVSSILFSEMVGASGVFEYSFNRLEGVRLNDRFFSETGMLRPMQGESLFLADAIKGSDYKSLCAVLKKMQKDKQDDIAVCQFYSVAGKGFDRTIELSVHPLAEDEGSLLVFISAKDITASIQDKNRLVELTSRYGMILNTINILTFDYNPADDTMNYSIHRRGGETSNITIESYLNYLPKSLVIHPESVDEVRKMLICSRGRKISGSIDCLMKIEGDEYEKHKIGYVSINDSTESIIRVIGCIVL